MSVRRRRGPLAHDGCGSRGALSKKIEKASGNQYGKSDSRTKHDVLTDAGIPLNSARLSGAEALGGCILAKSWTGAASYIATY
jgi:hypothetical protein